MSDLAPFVAAAIESKVVEDLKEENDRLRDEMKQMKAAALWSLEGGGGVQITGKGGAPIYASALISSAEQPYHSGYNEVHPFEIDLRNT